MQQKTLILGASGQIGTELTLALRKRQDPSSVIASDIRDGNAVLAQGGPFVIADVLDAKGLEDTIRTNEIEVVYLLAAMLSAKSEKHPELAWELNMQSLLHVLELAKNNRIKKIFWPSSIAVFGPGTPKQLAPQQTIMDPTTVYGISKLAGERWCTYYHQKYGVDVRSIRYPGLLSWKTQPGGGTTDYAIAMCQNAAKNIPYTCYLKPNTRLPMMFMDDAIRGTLELMDAASENIKIRSAYNLAAFSFTPAELEASIRMLRPDFQVIYEPDYRQHIAESWPGNLDDTSARKQWGWEPAYTLEQTTRIMLENIT